SETGGRAVNPLTVAMPAAIAELLRSIPISPGKVAFAWKTAVGPALDRVTSVCLAGDVLIVDAATAAWAREISRAAPTILQRLQGQLGEQAVVRIEVRSRD